MRRSQVLSVLCGLLFSFNVTAEQAVQRGNYEIHYSAFNSTFIEPQVAKAYDLVRSKYKGVLNVAVLRLSDKVASTALVKGGVKNLVGQQQTMRFREVREGNAIYYLADFRFTDDEVLRFELEVQPDPNAAPYTVSFQQHFYAE